jgi:hypothetical protein
LNDATTLPQTEPDKRLFAALGVRDYLYLWLGMLGSAFAMNMQQVAQGWLVYEMTSSAIQLTWVTLAFMLPQVFLRSSAACSQIAFEKNRSLAGPRSSTGLQPFT